MQQTIKQMAQVFSAGAWQERNHLFTGFNHVSHKTGGSTNNWQEQFHISLQEHRCQERGSTLCPAEPWVSPQFWSSVNSSVDPQPGLGIPPPPHIPVTDILSHGGRQSVLTSTPLPEAIPIQKMALSAALWNFLHISLHHPLVCSSFNLFFQFSK